MQYKGSDSLPMVRMVVQVANALREIGLQVPWNEAGPVCEADVPHDGMTLRLRHEFSAATARLFITTVLITPTGADTQAVASIAPTEGERLFIDKCGRLACSEVLELLPGDATPRFIGRLLDRATKRMFRLAEAVEILPKT